MKLFPEHEIYSGDETEEGSCVVPMEVFTLKHEGGEDGEDGEGDNLLNHLQLHEGIRSPIAYKTNLIGWHLQGVLEEGDTP